MHKASDIKPPAGGLNGTLGQIKRPMSHSENFHLKEMTAPGKPGVPPPVNKGEGGPAGATYPWKKSAAFALGAAGGYKQQIGLSDNVFVKIARLSKANPAQIKKAYFQKAAVNWGAMLLGGGVGLGGLALTRSLLGGTRQPAVNAGVSRDPMHEKTLNMGAYNQAISRDAQLGRGAFAAAPDPMGKSGALSEASVTKLAGFWGGAAEGAGLGAMAGSAIPGVGTAIGAGLGGLAGGIHGWMTGGTQQPTVNMGVKRDPWHEKTLNMGLYNQSLSRDAQLSRGAFAAAPNPYGNS